MVDYPAIAEIITATEQPYDAGDPEKVNDARKKMGRKKRDHLDFVKSILDMQQGREWYYKLLLACESHRLSYVKGEDSRDQAFRNGKQFIGFQLEADAKKADLDKFFLMIKECEEKKLTPLFPVDGIV